MSCERFESRLITGEKPADDPELGAHVGSCLRCFRTAADMREVPRLAALLRQVDAEAAGELGGGIGNSAPDPGARFWEKFPGQVGAAWVSARAGKRPEELRRWAWVARWWRQPLPAALTGAACAVALAFLVMRPAAEGPAGRPPAGAFDLWVELGTAYSTEIVTAPDDTIAELDIEGLTSLRDDLHRALGPGPEDQASSAELDDATPVTSSDPNTVADDLELLDEVGLVALQERLR
jgi:hypothetical protein